MNPRKLMAAVFCVAACASTTTFAEDDFGIESASPLVIADPVNPQPGMVLSGYKVPLYPNNNWYKDCVVTLPKAPAIKTVVDKSESFSLRALGTTDSNAGMWSGFMKCKRAAVYTLTLSVKHGNDRYTLRVNGKSVIVKGRGQTSADVALKAGWNKIELVYRQFSKSQLELSYKPKESLDDARPLTPAMIFHDKKPEKEW